MSRVLISAAVVLLALVSLWQFEGLGLVSSFLESHNTWTALLLSAALYAVLLSLPFVPGVELGWLIIGLFGIPGIVVSWVSTVLGLALGFGSARLLRQHPTFARLLLRRRELSDADPTHLSFIPFVMQQCLVWQERHPYLFLLVTLNLPGNLVLGGGGGIAWLTAVTPGIRFLQFVLVVAIGTSGVPLVLLAGSL